MKKITKIVAAMVTLGGMILQRKDVQDAILAVIKAHPHASWTAIIGLLLTALVHNPSNDTAK